MEILEKMATLWEGVDVVKRNQELLALKVIQVEGILKSLPAEHIEMLRKRFDTFNKLLTKIIIEAKLVLNLL